MEEISTWRDPTSSSRAATQKNAMQSHSFVVGMLTLRNILAVTKPLATSLQAINKDLLSCLEEVRLCIAVLEEKRSDPHVLMDSIAEEAERLLEEDLNMPRISSRQMNRPNVGATNAREYYARTLLIPFLDGIITDLKDRFSEHTATAFRIYRPSFLPSFPVTRLKR